MNETQRRLVHAIFLYTCIEGLVVNFFYPNPLAYLPKDVLIAFLYLGLISNPAARGGGISRLSGPFGAFAAVCLFYIVMPTPVSPVGISVGTAGAGSPTSRYRSTSSSASPPTSK